MKGATSLYFVKAHSEQGFLTTFPHTGFRNQLEISRYGSGDFSVFDEQLQIRGRSTCSYCNFRAKSHTIVYAATKIASEQSLRAVEGKAKVREEKRWKERQSDKGEEK